MVDVGAVVNAEGATVDAGTRADVAYRTVLRAWRDAIVEALPGVLDDAHADHLHDLRVAVRRSRSLLGQADGVLPPRPVERLAGGLRWIQQVTGDLRDLDVQLATLPSWRARLAPSSAGALEPLEASLRARRDAARADVARALGSRRLRRLLGEGSAFLAATPTGGRRTPGAAQPVGPLARERVAALHRKVLKAGRAIDAASPAEDLHALRKRCKKLRYVLDAWRCVLDADAADRVLDDLKALQRLLGDFQDLEVQAASLADLAAARMRDGRFPPDTVLAIGALVDRLRVAQAEARAAFERTFERFDRDKVRRHVDALLA